MAKTQIVIVTQQMDPHADEVIQALHRMGHEPVRLNTDDIPLNIAMSLDFEKGVNAWQGSINILTNERSISIDATHSIWWRRPGEFNLPADLTEQERQFATDETDHVLQGLWASLDDRYWISYPEDIRRASWKGGQLRRAAQVGLEVPRTLITTNPGDARAFYDACNGQVVFKVLSDPWLGARKLLQKHSSQTLIEPYGTYTTRISESELKLLDSVHLVPCLFQEYLPKQVELRVTVIGDEIFTAEIHSQTHEKTQVDWRHAGANIPYRKTTLPGEVAEHCLAFVRSYKLNFSAMDLILTPDGRYIFLENNPNGQFIFVEKRVPELRMTEALAACLIRGANS